MNRTMKGIKYGNKPTEVDGIKFQSIGEAKRWGELKWLREAGEVSDIETHPKFVLINEQIQNGEKYKKIHWEADFKYYYYPDDVWIVEDVKGCETARFKVIKTLFVYIYGDIYRLYVNHI